MKKILFILLWCLVGIGLFSLLIFIHHKIKSTPCKGINIVIDYQESDPLFSSGDIMEKVVRICDTVAGQPMKSIDLPALHDSLISDPFIQSVDIQSDFEGNIRLRVRQRNPILRIFSKGGDDYYLSADGKMLPCRRYFPVQVPVVSGDIFTAYNPRLQLEISKTSEADSTTKALIIYQLYKMGKYLQQDKWMFAFIDQINVQGANFILIPRLGSFSVYFGNAEELEEKFIKLKTFIRKGINGAGWNKYSQVNLVYKNQVVCKK